jgi:hypothetical protein
MHPAQSLKHALGDVVYAVVLAAMNDQDKFGEHGGYDRAENGFDRGEEVYRGISQSQRLK